MGFTHKEDDKYKCPGCGRYYATSTNCGWCHKRVRTVKEDEEVTEQVVDVPPPAVESQAPPPEPEVLVVPEASQPGRLARRER